MRTLLLVMGMVVCSLAFAQVDGLIGQRKQVQLMGCAFSLTAVAEDTAIAWVAIRAGIQEISRIEKVISSWDPTSQTSEVNNMAGIQAVKVDKELFDLIFRSKKISALTQGAFDISFASMDRIWKFDGSMKEMPLPEEVAAAKAAINWDHIELNSEEQTVFLSQKGMKIGFGAIGKGYAANRAKAVMQKIPGVKGGVVNASGDLITWGESTKKEGWTISISDPKTPAQSLGWLQVNQLAVVTSGDYEKFIQFEGKRFAHIIDPRTGYPTTGIKSVTIVCVDAELADALATSVFVLGKEKGLTLINTLSGVEGLIVTDADEVVTSGGLKLNYY